MAKRILLVDDDALLRRSLGFSLERAGYQVSSVSCAEDALALVGRQLPDLVLLDIGLPGMDGLDALRRLRDLGRVPVVFLTARRRELDQVLGLELGADDYIAKPFDLDVLLARIRVALRHSEPTDPPSDRTSPLVVGDIVIDAGAHTVSVAERNVDLPPREFDLLYTLAVSADRVVSVDDLLARVWGAEFDGQSEMVYVHINWLRAKIEDLPHQPRRVITVRGVGYKLVSQ